jgi:hypothetical protein
LYFVLDLFGLVQVEVGFYAVDHISDNDLRFDQVIIDAELLGALTVTFLAQGS